MIKTIIVDDEKHCRKTLEILLKEYCPDVQVIQECDSAEKAIETIKNLSPDIVFLDIEMPYMNGFEMLKQFSTIPFSVIFTTGYDQYAIQAFRSSAIDYLLKPVEAKELIAAVQKVRERKQIQPEQFAILLQQMQAGANQISRIAVPTHDGFELIDVKDITRCEASDNYTIFYLKNLRKITVCRTLKEVCEQLTPFAFFIRVHNSFAVNLNEVTKYVRGEGGYVIMSDGSNISVSRSRKEALIKLF